MRCRRVQADPPQERSTPEPAVVCFPFYGKQFPCNAVSQGFRQAPFRRHTGRQGSLQMFRALARTSAIREKRLCPVEGGLVFAGSNTGMGSGGAHRKLIGFVQFLEK